MSLAESRVETPAIGVPQPLIDGPQKVMGRALYSADFQAAGMAVGRVLRSPHAHARFVNIDTTAAYDDDAVVAVFTAEDLGAFCAPSPLVVSPPPIEDLVFNKRTQTPLAREIVRCVHRSRFQNR